MSKYAHFTWLFFLHCLCSLNLSASDVSDIYREIGNSEVSLGAIHYIDNNRLILTLDNNNTLKIWATLQGKKLIEQKGVLALTVDDTTNSFALLTVDGEFAALTIDKAIVRLQVYPELSDENQQKINLFNYTAINFLKSNFNKNYEQFLTYWAAHHGHTVAYARHKERGAFKRLTTIQQKLYREAIQGYPEPFNWKR